MITLHQVYLPRGGLRFFHFFSLYKKQRDFLHERGVWWNVWSLPFSVADSVWQRYFMKMSGLVQMDDLGLGWLIWPPLFLEFSDLT